MYWRREYLQRINTITTLIPLVFPLPRSGKLGSLMLHVSAVDAAGLGQAAGPWRPIDYISKITVILDGGTVVKSLTGYEIGALEFWDQGVMSPSRWRNYATNAQSQWLLINFGRWLRDTDLGLDLSRYNSAELVIENTFTAAQFSSMTVTVSGFFLEDAPATQFAGYLRTEEWRAWTTVADQWIYNELPTEYLLRRVMLQAIPHATTGINDTNMHNLMLDLDFSINTGANRIFLGALEDLMRENHYYMGRPAITGGLLYKNVDVGGDFSTGYGLYRGAVSGSKDGAVSAVVPTLTADENNGSQTPEGYEADSPIEIVNVGLAPFYTALINFDDDPTPTTWLDPNMRKVVKLDVHTRNAAASAGGRNAIVLDRLVRG